jgi:putative MATE family efflux protein
MSSTPKKKDTIMTEGSIIGHFIKFAVPLMLGYIFQQLYNTVDSITVGQFVSVQALAAVGSTGSIQNMLIGMFMGFATGAGVIISQHYGAKEDQKVSEAVHTSMVLALVFGVFITIAGYFLAPVMLRFMSTPDDVFPEALVYLRIYFAGSIGLLVYNMGSGILRSVGDSQRPLYFLIISAVVNIVFDLLFVIVFNMGIAGVGYATILAEFVSAVCVVYVLMKADGNYKLKPRELKLHLPMLRRIIQIGLPTSIQQMLVSFSNVFVQSYINSFQTACMAGWSSYNKIDGFTGIPMMSISLACTTFVGQNVGSGNIKRAKQGTKTAFCMGAVSLVILIIVLETFAVPLIGLFSSDEDAIKYGVMFLRWMTPMNFLMIANQIFAGSLRGVGDTKWPTVIQICSFIVVRQIYLAIISRVTDSPLAIGLGYPVGWFVCSTAMTLYYFFSHWEERRIVLTKQPEKA